MSTGRYAEVVETPDFNRAAKKLLGDDDLGALIWTLAQEPRTGDVMPRTGGFRKLRWARPGRGKRGGARVIYYYVDRRERIYLVYAYAKNERDNLSREQENELQLLAALLDKEE